jgi:hypothetical protein
MRRQLQTVRTSGLHRPDAILDKASRVEDRLDVSLHCPNAQTLVWKLRAVEVQPSGH